MMDNSIELYREKLCIGTQWHLQLKVDKNVAFFIIFVASLFDISCYQET